MFARRLAFLAVLVPLFFCTARADEKAPALKFSQRYRVPVSDDSYEVRVKEVLWQPARTAIIVCDMWDSHHCLNAVRRVEELAPVMNRVLERARSQGVLIIHAPSSCMEPYKDHPGRKRAQAAPVAMNLPKDIGEWCRKIPAEDK